MVFESEYEKIRHIIACFPISCMFPSGVTFSDSFFGELDSFVWDDHKCIIKKYTCKGNVRQIWIFLITFQNWNVFLVIEKYWDFLILSCILLRCSTSRQLQVILKSHSLCKPLFSFNGIIQMTYPVSKFHSSPINQDKDVKVPFPI